MGKISAYDPVVSPADTDETIVVQDGVNLRETRAQLTADCVKKDQTTPQEFVNGVPTLEATRVIDSDNQIIDKSYADMVQSGGMKSQFFTKVASDVADMYQATTILPERTVQTITGVATDGETVLASFIEDVNTVPYRVIDGSRFFHVTAKTSSTSKPVQLKGYVYQCDVDGANPVLLRTSTLSLPLTTLDAEYSMSVWGGSLLIPITMRIKFVIAVVKIGTGSDPTITLSVEDDTFSRLDVPSPTGVTDLSGVVSVDQTDPQELTGTFLFPTAKFGGETDNTEFEADGTMKLNGASTVTEDLNFDPTRSGGPVATRPSEVTINNVFRVEFTSANNQTCGANKELPHKYKLGSALSPHCHIFLKNGESAGTTGVTFTIYWELRQSTGTTNGSTTVSATSVELASTAGGNKLDLFNSSFAGSAELGPDVALTIARTAGDAGDIVVLTYGVHYEIDSLGSKTATEK